MKGFDVLHVKSAVKSRSEFNLSRAHLTTMNFGEIVPLFNEETVPGDKIDVSADYFSRMAPLAKPTYGKFQFKTVAGFVPYHQIAWDSDAWLAGKTTWEGQTPTGRFITVGNLAEFVRGDCCTSVGANSGNCDYSWYAADGTLHYEKFTTKGKYWVKVLNSLGYAIPQGVNLATTSDWYVNIRSQKLSAYPLLAFFKLYNDYMSQSQRFNTSALSDALQKIKYGKTLTGYTPSTGAINQTLLVTLFSNLKLNYENDYFTSAWQTPNAPAGTSEGVTQMDVPSISRDDKIFWDSDHDELRVQVASGTPYDTARISQRALDFLKSFDDWVRRNNYSGSRAVQQVYSRFGVKTDDYRSHYANVIKTDSTPVQVGDVTAMAAEPGPSTPTPQSTNILGGYAGKGIVSTEHKVSCAVSDYGLFIIIGYFTVAPMNSFGFDRKVLRNSPLDYYNPEFDGLGADAIPLMEVYENPRGVAEGDATMSNSVFGFTERYNAYRFGRDQITGEFRDFVNAGSGQTGMNVWHAGRFLGSVRKAGNLVAQSTSMNTLPQTNSEYNRIFAYTGGDLDHFYLTCQFNVKAIRPMMNLNQVPRLGEGDTTVPRNGNVIS